MKKLNNFLILLVSLILFIGCQDDDNTFGDINSPNGLEVSADIAGKDVANPNGDGSGTVTFKAVANDAISYKYIFSDGSTKNSPSGELEKQFTKNGINVYSITVVASGKAGVSSSITFDITVFSNFTDPVAVQNLTGGSSKKWYWSASEPGHLGVGKNIDARPEVATQPNHLPGYYTAAAFEKAGSPNTSCLYDNELIFSLQGDILKFELNNGGRTFFNSSFLSVGGGGGPDDLCLNYNTSGQKTVILGPSNSVVKGNNIPLQTTGTSMTIGDNGFMGYYIGQNTYEILSLTENRMVVRAVMGGNEALAWYHIFTTTKPVQGGGGTNDFTNLIWADEFNVDGPPNPANWSYNLGAGGWGNNEAQYYTNSTENSVVDNGVLKIIAKKQTIASSNYTSARLVSENKYEFKYGKIEFKAKMPTGGGTWPALWMLGENYALNPWPACGEIDVMEHRGNQQNTIHGTLHYPGRFGGSANTNTNIISNASSEFHIYAVIWNADSIRFFVDGTLYHSYANVASSPFNLNFFLIMNVAMGGTFGGAIDSGFTESAMEVDYVRVYQ